MNKKFFLVGLVILLAGSAFAQDSTMNTSAKQHHTTTHKKPMHNTPSTMPADSVNAGKITTNPNGKMGTRRKMPKSTIDSVK